jgi:hypothetical protein
MVRGTVTTPRGWLCGSRARTPDLTFDTNSEHSQWEQVKVLYPRLSRCVPAVKGS